MSLRNDKVSFCRGGEYKAKFWGAIRERLLILGGKKEVWGVGLLLVGLERPKSA